jgi:hypothetical protein
MDELDLGVTIKGFAIGQKVFGRYTLRKILGRGGMGVVWLARDEELEREVALKFLPEVVAMDREAVLDLKRETRRSLELTHPHIVRIYDFIQDARTAAISMEYVAGDTLAARKVDQPARCFEATDLKAWAQQLCEALAYAHTRGEVVHRDLKPANLMIDARGDLKIADFGIAASVSDSVSRVSAQAGSSGTPVYMSPQQMLGEKPAVTDDIYALGATLYELLTGKPPFYSGNVALQVQSKVPPPIAARRQELGATGASIPIEWESTIAACLAKETADRPQSAVGVARGLGLEVAKSAVTAPGSTAPARPADLDSGVTRRREPVPASPGLAALKPAAAEVRSVARSRAPRYLAIAAGVVLLAGGGYYFGVTVPEQNRLAAEKEKAAVDRRLAEQRQAAAAQAAAEQKRRQVEAEDKAYQEIERSVLGLAASAGRPEFEAVQKLSETYLATAPDRYRQVVTADWEKKTKAWLAYEAVHRPGALAVETDPAGATIILYPANIRRTSPAAFKDIPPGEASFRVEKDGYEPQDLTITVKPGDETKAGLVRLISLSGTAVVTSDPPGAKVSLDGNSRHFEGVTPFTQDQAPPGTYRVTLQRANWRPVEKSLVIKRNESASLTADLHGVALDLRSDPPGARVTLNGVVTGVTPLTLTDQAPGEYNVIMSLAGFDPATKTVTAESRTEVSLALSHTVAKIGRMVIVRQSHFVGSLGNPDVKIDGVVKGEINNGTYWAAELPVGEHDVAVKTVGVADAVAHVRIEPAGVVYLEMTIGMMGFNLAQISDVVAPGKLVGLRPASTSPLQLAVPEADRRVILGK